MAKHPRTRTASLLDARVRLRSAQAYLEVADLILSERDRVEMPGVAAGLAVLAGIAAGDAMVGDRPIEQVVHGERADRAQARRAVEGLGPAGTIAGVSAMRRAWCAPAEAAGCQIPVPVARHGGAARECERR